MRSVLQALLFHNRVQVLSIGFNYRVTNTGIRFLADFLAKVPTQAAYLSASRVYG